MYQYVSMYVMYISKEISQPWSTANDHTTFTRLTKGSDDSGMQ